MLEGNRLDCRTELHHRPLPAEHPSVCPSAGTGSPDHRTHCTHSTLSMRTWCSPLEERKGMWKNISIFLFCSVLWTLLRWPYILPQSFSSDPSTQSFCKSHLRSRWTHSPLAQENCLVEQGLGTCGETAGLAVVPEKKITYYYSTYIRIFQEITH